jgi:futalosine hydrolase
MLAILSSMPLESDLLYTRLKSVRKMKIAGKTAFRGKLRGQDVLLMNTGIGKVNAAHSATCVIEKFPVKKIVNIGVGGAYPGAGLKTGDIAVALKEIYGDEGVVDPKGWGSYKKIGIPLVQSGRKKYFNEFPVLIPRQFPVGTIHELSLQKDFKIKTGNFVTVSAATGTQKRAKELEQRFRAICENMEGAAIAQVCAIYKISMSEIRGISNIAGVRDKRKWNLKLASQNCQKAVLEGIGDLFNL